MNSRSDDLTQPRKNNWRRTGISPDGFVIVPPDGKWGWAVLFGCCLCGLSAVTVTIIFGVLLNELIILLHTTATTISWTLAISSGFGNILGPVVTIIIDTYSCRSSVIVGGMMISIGLILSSCVDTVELLMVTFGLFTGIGNCLTFVPLPVMLSLYFHKYFGIALGCVTAAYALSKLALTPVIQLILEEYGCRGTLLIMGGFMLNICVGASLFQPAQWHSILIQKAENTNGTTGTFHAKSVKNAKETDVPKSEDTETELQSLTTETEIIPQTVIPAVSIQRTECDPFLEECVQTKTEVQNSDWHNYEERRISNVSLHLASSLDIFGATNTEAFNRFNETSATKKMCCCTSWFKNKLLKSIDHTLLREKVFYIVCVQNAFLLGSLVYGTMYMFPFGTEAGLYPMQAAGLVSTRSIGELVGRLTGPVILTAFKLPTRITYVTCIFLHGISLIVLTYMTNFVSLYAAAGIAGLLFGSAVGLNGLLIVQTMGVKRLPSVLGLAAFFQGFFLFALGPITGWIRDVTGAYSYCLMLIGILQFFIAALWLLKPYVTSKNATKINT